MQSAVKLVPNIEETVSEYARLKEQAAELEAVLKRLRNVIEVALTAEPESRAVIAGYKLSVIQVERENFALKKAIEAMGKAPLSPFISTTNYTQLRIEPSGGKGDK